MDKKLKMFLSVIIGNVLVTAAVVCFILPHGIVMGGITGTSVAIQHYLNIDLAIAVYIVTGLVLLAGYVGNGRDYFLSMIAASVTYPMILQAFQMFPVLSTFTDDVLLATIFAGLLFGMGLGVVMKSGASAGGLDCFAIIINKYTHLPLASILRIIDISVLLLQVPFSTPEQILYGIVFILVSSFMLNYVVVSGKSQVQLMIISKDYEAILKSILEQIDVGATLIDIETGYNREKGQAVMIITSNRRVYTVTEIVHSIDAQAFITISNTNEVIGKGFTIAR